MSYVVTSWYIDQLANVASEPVRKLTIGSSDYSSFVAKWPKIKWTVNDLKAVNPSVTLYNQDGDLNTFYENVYLITTSADIQFGFTHPTSGDELITLWQGWLKRVNYSRENCIVHFEDTMRVLNERTVGDSKTPLNLGPVVPSHIGISLVNSHALLDTPTYVDEAEYLIWAEVFSRDNVLGSARYEGIKVREALSRLGKNTDSAIWIAGDGKIHFKRFEAVSSNDITLTKDEINDLQINLDDTRLINKQWVYADYKQESDFYNIIVNHVSSSSVNTYGVRENIMKDETFWFADSASAFNMASRKTVLFHDVPKKFNLQTSLIGLQLEIGDTVRVDDEFFGITSADAWRITEYDLDINNGIIDWELDEAASLYGFILDIDQLDGPKVLL
jgi:hypothetical protein